ncbi:hypothetical protein IGK81_002830 [Enterococcus sp. DIV0703]|jgi:hypothetical protein
MVATVEMKEETLMTKKHLLFDSILLGILGFSPMLLSGINKGTKKGELKLNPNYYNSPNEGLFVEEPDK